MRRGESGAALQDRVWRPRLASPQTPCQQPQRLRRCKTSGSQNTGPAAELALGGPQAPPETLLALEEQRAPASAGPRQRRGGRSAGPAPRSDRTELQAGHRERSAEAGSRAAARGVGTAAGRAAGGCPRGGVGKWVTGERRAEAPWGNGERESAGDLVCWELGEQRRRFPGALAEDLQPKLTFPFGETRTAELKAGTFVLLSSLIFCFKQSSSLALWW